MNCVLTRIYNKATPSPIASELDSAWRMIWAVTSRFHISSSSQATETGCAVPLSGVAAITSNSAGSPSNTPAPVNADRVCRIRAGLFVR